jgi:hypothetical protein
MTRRNASLSPLGTVLWRTQEDRRNYPQNPEHPFCPMGSVNREAGSGQHEADDANRLWLGLGMPKVDPTV